MVAAALAEIVGIGAVIPLIGALAAPDSESVRRVADLVGGWVGVTDRRSIVMLLAGAFIGLAVAAGAIRVLFLWGSVRYSAGVGTDLNSKLFRTTLYRPYEWHVQRNSSEAVAGITNKIDALVFGIVLPTLTLGSSAVLAGAIVAALVLIDPRIAATSTLILGGAYVAVSWNVRRRLAHNSRRIATGQIQVVQRLQEGVGAIRDVLLSGNQEVYASAYRDVDRPLRRAQGENQFLGLAPRFIMETAGILFLVAWAVVLDADGSGGAQGLALLGAVALAAQRLLPALQQGYVAWSNLNGNQSALADFLGFLDEPTDSAVVADGGRRLDCTKELRLDGVSFRYQDSDQWALEEVDLTIAHGTRVGIAGGTGGGKSTLADVIMGLLAPQVGTMSVDGTALEGEAVQAWQRSIAHVPQDIFLTDGTVAENVALGTPPDEIDAVRVLDALERARLTDVVAKLPLGVNTKVGERGLRLSGGQRQRLGIARALYKEATLLIFDEATSALDTATENEVMDAIRGLGDHLTLILIAHRVTTLRACDRVLIMKQGRIHIEGGYDELMAESEEFRELAGIGRDGGTPILEGTR